jgi:hypothetical protein
MKAIRSSSEKSSLNHFARVGWPVELGQHNDLLSEARIQERSPAEMQLDFPIHPGADGKSRTGDSMRPKHSMPGTYLPPTSQSHAHLLAVDLDGTHPEGNDRKKMIGKCFFLRDRV